MSCVYRNVVNKIPPLFNTYSNVEEIVQLSNTGSRTVGRCFAYYLGGSSNFDSKEVIHKMLNVLKRKCVYGNSGVKSADSISLVE